METNEFDVRPIPEPELVLTPEALYYLRESGKWANFLSIVGFIICGLLLIVALFVGTMFAALSRLSPVYSAMPAGIGGIFSVIIILVDVLYFFFALYLYQFAERIKKGITFVDTDHVTMALGKLKSFFKLWGIVTIVVLCLYALEIAAVFLFALARR
jgi:hypothetical protein